MLGSLAGFARSAGKRYLEIDLPLGAVARLRRRGFAPVATMLRLSDRPVTYRSGHPGLLVAGRWSL